VGVEERIVHPVRSVHLPSARYRKRYTNSAAVPGLTGEKGTAKDAEDAEKGLSWPDRKKKALPCDSVAALPPGNAGILACIRPVPSPGAWVRLV